ncbi:MAG: InlB B-repeat-containing protein, partial [Clostridia bacterium]|nr:InlB B-repeat-containing protein [Clostridia bacterium]
FKKDGNGWNLTTEGDKGRHISAVITLVDSSLTTAPALQFNDVNLDNSMYQVEEITNGWKYTVDFYITEEMVTAKGSTAYDTNYRFIDIVTTTDSSVITVSSATLGGNMYYDAEGKGVLVSDFETNDTLYARWTTNEYYLNIKGLLDGVESANIGSYGTVDVYVNGVQVADDVIDYYTKHPYGSTYEIKDIKVATGKTFVQSGSNALSGTINVTSGEKTVILKFTTNTYTISFNGNGNTGGSTASMSMTYGTAKNLTANGFTKTGYTFAGWNTKADGTGTGYTNQQSVNNLTATNGATVTLYAQWTAKSVTITLDRVGGTGGTASVQATYGSALPDIVAPTKAGYTFAGYFADDRTTSLASEIIYNSSSSYARVNFKKDGNDWNLTTDGDKGRHLTAVIIFVDPSRTNAPQIQFNDVNLDNSMYQVEEITNGWKYTVDFDITEEMVTAKGSTLYNTNLRFIDFSCVPTSDTVITVSSATLGGNMYYDAEGKGVLVSDFETNDTLYARWTGNTYTIKFNGNGNTGGSTAQMSMTYGTAKELTANGFTKTGYTFNGWNTVADGTGDSYTDKQSVNNLTATDGATVTLYAQWTANTYTVTFDANGGTCDTESITVAYQTPYGELPTATKTGYIFTGWYASTTSTTQILPTTKFTKTSDQILYAKWTPITYTIRYLPNGGSGSAAADEICNYDELHTLSRTNYNRTGYRFVGWNTKADGTGDFYEYGAQVKNLTDVDGEIVILYAVWEALSYTVRFKLNGGEYVEITSKTVTYDSPYGELPIPTRKGYTFTGWYTSSSSTGVLVTEETIVSRTVDHDLYAHWKVADGYDLMATSPDAYMTVSIGEEAATLEGDVYQIKLPAGTKVTITANVNNGETRKFMCWRDDRMRIVSREEKYTFVLEADKKIEAVYSEEANSEYYTVVFVDSILKMVVDIQRVVKGGSATVPTLTTENAGYVFDKWDTDTTEVNGNLIVEAIYRPRNNIHTIKIVIGDTESESKYYYNTPVTAAITDDQIPEGQNFAGWTFDGKTIASYDREFRFYVYKDLTVTAVFATAETEEKPTVVLTTTIKEQTATTYKAEFMVTRTVPEDYVFVSSGLLLTQSAEYGTNEKLTFESYSVDEQTAIRLYRTVHTTNDGQYQLTVKTSSGKTFYARGFIVYINGDGEIITDYTDVVSVTDK